MSVVIGLQSTGEAVSRESFLQSLGESNNGDPHSSPRRMLEKIIEKLFPIPSEENCWEEYESGDLPSGSPESGQFATEDRKDEQGTQSTSSASGVKLDPGRSVMTLGGGGSGKRPTSPLIINLVEESDSESSIDERDGIIYICSDSEDEDNDPPSAPRQAALPAPPPSPASPTAATLSPSPSHISSRTKTRLLFIEKVNELKRLARELPLPGHPLDDLIDQLGGIEKVAEMTGRHNRSLRCPESGKWIYRSRTTVRESTTDEVNFQEREAFQNGLKRVAIISDACSCGISLHADQRKENKQRRLHLTLELAWSADKAIQQLGRTHRSNQASAPLYRLLITPYAGEKRFVSSITKRLESLGALTQGDRRASLDAFAGFEYQTKEGSEALKSLKFAVLEQSLDSDFPLSLDEEESAKTLALLKSNPALINSIRRCGKIPNLESLLRDGNQEPLRGVFAALIWLDAVGLSIETLRQCSVPIFLNRLLSLEGNRQEILFKVSLSLSSSTSVSSLSSGTVRYSTPSSRIKSDRRRWRGNTTRACWSLETAEF
jgi:hypothetical protein